MSKVSELLAAKKSNGNGALIGYFPAGFPTVDESVEALVEMCKSGVDILEIGVPYSDPVMDGEVIQQATELALQNGFKLPMLFEVISKVRSQVDNPILVMSYWNPIISYGVRRFAEDLKKCGAQGIITPDLIPDEAKDWLSISDELDLDRVFLVAPSSSPQRIKDNADLSRGFVYAVSTMGITGERSELDRLASETVSKVKKVSDTPVCVGVGVSNSEQVKAVNGYADGAIVGTAIIRAYQTNALSGLKDKVSELAQGLG